VTEGSGSPGSDPIGEFQRWLMRRSARNLGREVRGTVRRTFSGNSDRGDVWDTATSEPLPGEAPECAWCPVCRAARKFRESGPGLASHVAGAGDALFSVAQDALAAFEATLSARPPQGWHGSPGHESRGNGPSGHASPGHGSPGHGSPGQESQGHREGPGPAAGSPEGTGWPGDADTGQADGPDSRA
jgi:hypothetical protein